MERQWINHNIAKMQTYLARYEDKEIVDPMAYYDIPKFLEIQLGTLAFFLKKLKINIKFININTK